MAITPENWKVIRQCEVELAKQILPIIKELYYGEIMFTKTDKALLDRAARFLTSEAMKLQAFHPVWGASEKSKKAKLEFDRLHRDARDLRAMGKRIFPKPKAVVMPELPLHLNVAEGGSYHHDS